MEHLTHETLARLVDERPNPDEQEHLKACNRCAEEFRALRLQSVPARPWPRLASRCKTPRA